MKDTLLVCRVFLSLSLVCRGSKSLRITELKAEILVISLWNHKSYFFFLKDLKFLNFKCKKSVAIV
jgi:hypothetical protein